MEKGLMARDGWDNLGLVFDEKTEEKTETDDGTK